MKEALCDLNPDLAVKADRRPFPAKIPEKIPEEQRAIRKWVFSFDQRASGWFADMIKVAVISARQNTSLGTNLPFRRWKRSGHYIVA